MAKSRRGALDLETLSSREALVLREVVHGFSDTQIAELHHCARATVQNHIKHLYRKLHCPTRVLLIVRYWRDTEQRLL